MPSLQNVSPDHSEAISEIGAPENEVVSEKPIPRRKRLGLPVRLPVAGRRQTGGTQTGARKRGMVHALSTLLLALGMAACGQEKPAPPSAAEPPTVLRVSGSDAASVLLRKLGHEFERAQPAVRLQLLPETHSRGAVGGVASGNLDIGLVSRELFEEERGLGLQYFHLALDPLVLAVHKDAGVESLTQRQVRAIYTGEVTDWKEVGGRPGRIQVVDRPEHASAKIYFRRAILGKEPRVTPQAVTVEVVGEVPDVIQRMPGAIGYTSLTTIADRDTGLRVPKLDGVTPTPESVEAGRYRFSRPLGLVIPAQPKREAMRFLDFILGEVGRQVAQSMGYVPVLTNLTIGVVPEQDVLTQNARYTPLARYLTERLGMQARVEVKLFPSYAQVIQALQEGKVNAAFLGSFAYVEARRRMALEAVARPMVRGVAEYRGLLVVRRGSGLSPASSFKGLRLALVDRLTTAGYLFPVLFFRERGITRLEEGFRRVSYAGTHEASIRQLLNGEADVATAKDLVFQRLAAKDPRVNRELEVIARSEPVPENALVVGARVDVACLSCHERGRKGGPAAAVSLAARLRQILVSMQEDEAGRSALQSLGATQFIPTSDGEYEPVRRMWRDVREGQDALAERKP